MWRSKEAEKVCSMCCKNLNRCVKGSKTNGKSGDVPSEVYSGYSCHLTFLSPRDPLVPDTDKDSFISTVALIDSNHDGKIDKRDELFNRLQIWNDVKGDGTTQSDELSSLKDAGVKSIDLNYVSTNITLGGATLTEASKYIDKEGNKELVADVNLAYNPQLDFKLQREVA